MNEKIEKSTPNKYTQLVWSILLDGVGYLSYLIPALGEFSDIIWAPIAAIILYKMYKGTAGKIGGITVFLEELSPGLDFIPTFTLTWLYTHFLQKKKP